jgi:hypothetical protein
MRMQFIVEMTKDAALGYLKSEHGTELFHNGVITALKSDGVIESFVQGVVDNKIYKTLEDESMGRAVGEYIVKSLEK